MDHERQAQRRDREKAIASMWTVQSESGVAVYPMKAAVDAADNLGCDVADARDLLSRAERMYEARAFDDLLVCSARINRVLASAIAEVREDAPSTWDAYRTMLSVQPAKNGPGPLPAAYDDAVKGAWLGKCIGTSLGDPVEGWTREAIRSKYGSIDGYLVPPRTENDDTAYPILVLHALDEYGIDFTSENLGMEWIAHLPYAYTAEQAALDNLKAGLVPPETRWRGNPCGAWIGAQMRGEIHGLIAPSSPEKAAEFAFRDAVLSHYREGLDGEIYAAALISLAFERPPIERLLRDALAFVPRSSSLVETVERTIAACLRYGEWEPVVEEIEVEMARFHWIHALPNLACVICGLLLGEGKFERTILTTLACGFDTDCTVGQAGALLGTLVGAGRIPEKWAAPIGNTLETYVIGFERLGIDELVRWTTSWGHRVVERLADDGSGDCTRRGGTR